MSDLNHKLRRSRRFRLELLESRELLSGVGLSAYQAAEVSALLSPRRATIKGSLSGHGPVNPSTSSQGTTHFSSSGTTTVLGSTTFEGSVSYSEKKSHAISYSKGVGTLADLSGDLIKISFSGSGRDAGAGDFTFSVKGPVSGGTGTYARADGFVHREGEPQYWNGRLLDRSHRDPHRHLNVLNCRSQNSWFPTPERLRCSPRGRQAMPQRASFGL